MGFQISALDAAQYQHLFHLSDAALAEQKACRMVVTEKPGTPCRVSMADAEVGETVILVNHCHQAAKSPYQASHAVFVREGEETVQLAAGEVPEVLTCRLISVRLFDVNDMMIDADVVPGTELATALNAAFERPDVAYIHLHYAKPGCFAASVRRT